MNQNRIRASRWRCRNHLCQKKFFSTPLATIAAAYERQTSRANAVTLMVGRALGGRAAERLMSRLGMPVSDDTVLRRLKHAACQHEEAKPRVIGIDDWAQRKGQIYGTIVVDLERRCVVDLLPDRSAETVVRWLLAHPEIHTISRDRNGLYAQAVRQAAPHAMQIADRFHLVQNLREAAQPELATQRAYLGVQLIPAPAPLGAVAVVPVDPPARPRKNRIVLSPPVIQRDEIAQQRRQHDLEIFAAVIRLREQGLNVKQISHTLQLNRRRNLVVNARDAMPRGGTLTITTRIVRLDGAPAGTDSKLAPGTYVQLTVSDNGSGMDRETQRHLFEPFFTTKPKGKGTGLGLAIVHGIVSQLCGDIKVHSELGAGTTFTIWLPITAERPIEKPAIPGEAPGPENPNITVLLAEDDGDVRHLARHMLLTHGYTVYETADCAEAIRICETIHVDVLLTDVVMPEMNGRELADVLRRSNESLKVVYMSGYIDDSLFPPNFLEPGSNFIRKPFTADYLHERIAAICNRGGLTNAVTGI